MRTIPKTDTEAWLLYPKLSWVYSTTALLDFQHVSWLPFRHEDYIHGLPVFNVEEHYGHPFSNIYIRSLEGEPISTVVALAKGEVKWHAHHNGNSQLIDEEHGNQLLKIKSFIMMHLKKHTGMVMFETVGNTLTGVRLRHLPHLVRQYPEGFDAALNTLYRRSQWTL